MPPRRVGIDVTAQGRIWLTLVVDLIRVKVLHVAGQPLVRELGFAMVLSVAIAVRLQQIIHQQIDRVDR